MIMNAESQALDMALSRPWNIGITGIDVTQPIYDGTSSNSADHLIELDTPMMETAPDVRPYFWRIGQSQLGHSHFDISADLDHRRLYDSELVMEGRLFLQSARPRGVG